MPYNRRFVLFTRLGHTATTSCVYSAGRISIWNRIISCCWESSSWIIGFALKLDAILIIIVSAVATALVGGIIPKGNVTIGIIVFGVGMMLFTMIMGNAFAAITVMTVGIGAPFVLAVWRPTSTSCPLRCST